MEMDEVLVDVSRMKILETEYAEHVMLETRVGGFLIEDSSSREIEEFVSIMACLISVHYVPIPRTSYLGCPLGNEEMYRLGECTRIRNRLGRSACEIVTVR